MKKISFMAALLALPISTVFASETISKMTLNIGVINNTADSITVSCLAGDRNQGDYTLGGPKTIAKNSTQLFNGTIGRGCIGDISSHDVVCNYTDTTTGKTGYFKFTACATNSSGVNPIINPQYSCTNSNLTATETTGKPPTAFSCPKTLCSFGWNQNASVQCSGGWTASYYYCSASADFAVGTEGTVGPTYTLTWDNIKANLTKGQVMATKLTSMLKNIETSNTFGAPTVTFVNNSDNTQKMTIILPPPTVLNPDPYANATSFSDCQTAYNTFPQSP